MRFRPVRELLVESMAHLQAFETLDDLRAILAANGMTLVAVKPYDERPDDRIGWTRTCLVLVRVPGHPATHVGGFTDGIPSDADLPATNTSDESRQS